MKIGSALVVGMMLGLSSGAARGQDCSEADVERLAKQTALAELTSEAAQVSGKSDTWRDLLARLVADVDSLDLEQGDEATTLTWNVTPSIDAKAVVWKKPAIFATLGEALAEDEEERDRLGGKIKEGDDWEASVAGHWGWGTGRGFTGYYRQLARQATNSARKAATLYGLECKGLRSVLPREAIEAQGRLLRDPENPPREVSVRLFARERDELVGPNRRGFSVRYTYGIKPNAEEQDGGGSPAKSPALATAQEKAQAETRANAALELGPLAPTTELERRLMATLLPYLDQIVAASPAQDAAAVQTLNATRQPVPRTLAQRTALRDLVAGATPPQPSLQQRLAFEGEYLRVEDYDFTTASGVRLLLPREDSITATATYSLQMARDGVADPAAPLFELAAAYEHVDGDAERQERLLVSAMTTMRVAALAKDSDLTFGLHWASKPEYLIVGDDDRRLSARLALTLKMGAPPAIAK
jgi:hypothetical protein